MQPIFRHGLQSPELEGRKVFCKQLQRTVYLDNLLPANPCQCGVEKNAVSVIECHAMVIIMSRFVSCEMGTPNSIT